MISRNDGALALDSRQMAEAANNIVKVDPSTDILWRRLVDSHASNVFHSPQWMAALKETYDLDLQAAILLDESGDPLAGIPFARVSDILGDRIVTLPFSDYCDPIVGDVDQWSLLAGELLAQGCPVTVRCLHNEIPLQDERFAEVNRARWHGLRLDRDLDDIWQDLDGAARRAVRKAQRSGVTARVAEREEDLRAFFDMHLGVRKRKYRLLAQPYSFFQNIWSHLIGPGKGMLLLAVHENEIIGGVLYLEWKNKLYYKFNASRPGYLDYRPNDFLMWEGIQYARAKGYSLMDFGLSDWDQDELIRYKRKYANEEKTIHFMRHEPPADADPRAKELRSLLNRLTDLLTDDDVPDGVTNRAADILYRFFT